jgi:hypothetical protein
MVWFLFMLGVYLQRRDERKASRLQGLDEESKLDDEKATHVEVSDIN